MIPVDHGFYIVGWAALYDYTGMTDQKLRRVIGLYGFPAPLGVRRGSQFYYAWDKEKVDGWLAADEETRGQLRPRTERLRRFGTALEKPLRSLR